jgi:hypothetical protein
MTGRPGMALVITVGWMAALVCVACRALPLLSFHALTLARPSAVMVAVSLASSHSAAPAGGASACSRNVPASTRVGPLYWLVASTTSVPAPALTSVPAPPPPSSGSSKVAVVTSVWFAATSNTVPVATPSWTRAAVMAALDTTLTTVSSFQFPRTASGAPPSSAPPRRVRGPVSRDELLVAVRMPAPITVTGRGWAPNRPSLVVTRTVAPWLMVRLLADPMVPSVASDASRLSTPALTSVSPV